MNADELKKADEIVRALRCTKSQNKNCENCKYAVWMDDDSGLLDFCNTNALESDAADLIDSLTAQLSESQRRERDARNELCDKCGRYHEAHKGACDGCRWKETEQ